jgi:signal transduction histidine kinase/ActR/RegA family two-component response regulator
LAIAAFLCAAYGVTVWAGLQFAGSRAGPAIWPCNGFLAAMVVLLEWRLALTCFGICAAGSLPLFLSHSINIPFDLCRFLLNIIEPAMAGALARWVLGPRRLLRTTIGFLRLQFLAVLPACAIARLIWQFEFQLVLGRSVHQLWSGSFSSHVLGMAVVLPAMLLVFQPLKSELRRPKWEIGMTVAIVVLVITLMLAQSNLPISFVTFPVLLFAALRLGPRGSAVGSMILGVVALPATINGTGPFLIHPAWDFRERALIYQGFCLSSLFAVSLGAFMVSEQTRLRRLLVRRAASARQARRSAVIASRAKSEFLATMSHEIRTPMNSILGFTQVLLQDRGLSPTARSHAEVISQAGASLMTVLNDILDFSKVEAGQIELNLEPVDVAAAGRHAIDIVQEAARAKGLTLRMETGGAGGLFELDGQRLRQILLNLLNNAVKFTQEGHVLLAVTHLPERQTLRFEVRDTGIGVAPEVIARLFTRFSQADSSTTRDYGGSGLGLAICKGLVERMGGTIGIESRPATGSTFWFELPAKSLQAGVEYEKAEAPASDALHGRVLLVDDHAMNRKLGETLLRIMGCEVDLATSGEEAVAAASQRLYDAILMDVHMPRMDGLEAARAIRALDGPGRQAPIIAVSADVLSGNLELCRLAGMVDHIAKPIQMPVMHAVLKRWMGRQVRRSAA